MKHLVLSRVGRLDSYGNEQLTLTLLRTGKENATLPCISGAPGRQVFRRADDLAAAPGSMEPIPEGVYRIEKPLWAGDVGDRNRSLGPGLGPVRLYLTPQQPMPGGRGDFVFHLDANRDFAPGSAGCPVFVLWTYMQTLLDWQVAGCLLYVTWGLGLVKLPAVTRPPAPSPPVPAPALPSKAATEWWKFYVTEDRMAAFYGGHPLAAGEQKLYFHDGKYGVVIGGMTRRIRSARIEIELEVDPGELSEERLAGWLSDPNSPIARAVGYSEGTRTLDGDRTEAWGAHRDPGNGKLNLGTFSYQGPASDGAEADRIWGQILRERLYPEYLRACRKAKRNPLDVLLLALTADLYTQSPAAVWASGGWLEQLAKLPKQLTVPEAVKARVRAYHTPDGVLDAPGFGNSLKRLTADQTRRCQAVWDSLDHQGLL